MNFLFPVKLIREQYFMNNFNANAMFQGFTALHYAALMNNIESLEVLMKYGADPYLKSVTGLRPIDLVTDAQAYELLLEYENNVGSILHFLVKS